MSLLGQCPRVRVWREGFNPCWASPSPWPMGGPGSEGEGRLQSPPVSHWRRAPWTWDRKWPSSPKGRQLDLENGARKLWWGGNVCQLGKQEGAVCLTDWGLIDSTRVGSASSLLSPGFTCRHDAGAPRHRTDVPIDAVCVWEGSRIKNI